MLYSYDLDGHTQHNLQKKEIYAYTTNQLPPQPLKTVVYGYSDDNWKDKLTSYDDGQTNHKIIYDGVGNPLQCQNGWTFEWKNGRQLDKMLNNGYNIVCKYDDEGIRTEKVVNDVKTEFVTSGIQILAQKTGDDTIVWQIDGNGSTLGF